MKETYEQRQARRLTELLETTEKLEKRILRNQLQIEEDKEQLRLLGKEINFMQNLEIL